MALPKATSRAPIAMANPPRVPATILAFAEADVREGHVTDRTPATTSRIHRRSGTPRARTLGAGPSGAGGPPPVAGGAGGLGGAGGTRAPPESGSMPPDSHHVCVVARAVRTWRCSAVGRLIVSRDRPGDERLPLLRRRYRPSVPPGGCGSVPDGRRNPRRRREIRSRCDAWCGMVTRIDSGGCQWGRCTRRTVPVNRCSIVPSGVDRRCSGGRWPARSSSSWSSASSLSFRLPVAARAITPSSLGRHVPGGEHFEPSHDGTTRVRYLAEYETTDDLSTPSWWRQPTTIT